MTGGRSVYLISLVVSFHGMQQAAVFRQSAGYVLLLKGECLRGSVI